ncbi:MAG: cytochrome c [Sandaracinaceae bacterium]
MRLTSTPFWLAALALLSSACDEGPRNVREWTAEDHLQEAQADPSRVPAGQAVEASPEEIRAAAASLFAASCARCHGANGAGDGPDAPVAEMPSFASAEWQAARSDTDLARAIRMGQGLMPAFGSQLNDRGITALVQHVRRLGGEDAPAPPEEP